MNKIIVLSDIHLKHTDQFDMKDTAISQRSIQKIKRIKELIEQEKPDVLIDAGDLFNVPNPTEILRAVYFRTISKLVPKIILISGNHNSEKGLAVGTSETYTSDNITVIQPRQVYKFKNITLIGYTRDDEEFLRLCNENRNTYLITHRDIPNYDLPFDQAFFGHLHLPLTKGRKHSIGALFTDSFGEEGVPCRYLTITEEDYMFHEFEDIKIKTFDKLVDVADGEYTAIRFKLKGTAKDLLGINKKEIQSHYKETKVFVDLEVLSTEKIQEETMSVEDIVLGHLKEKGLTKSEIEFGVNHFKEIE